MHASALMPFLSYPGCQCATYSGTARRDCTTESPAGWRYGEFSQFSRFCLFSYVCISLLVCPKVHCFKAVVWIQHASHIPDCSKFTCLFMGQGGRVSLSTSGNGQARSSASSRGRWRTGKNGENWLRNHCAASTTLAVKG